MARKTQYPPSVPRLKRESGEPVSRRVRNTQSDNGRKIGAAIKQAARNAKSGK